MMSSQGRAVHFYTKIDEYILRTGELRVPPNFVSRYWTGMSNPVHFLLPDGAKWEVTWKKRDAEVVWLGNNWKKFAKFYSLDHQHLLMFKYERKSQFQVVICDQSFLEIGYPVFIGTFGVEEISDQSGNSREMFEGFSTPPNKRPNSSPQTDRVPEMKTFHEGFDTSTKPKSTGERQNMTGSKAMESEEPLLNTKSSNALKRAHAYPTENPSFIRQMHTSHIQTNFLSLPRRFLTASEQQVESATLWVSEERSWDVKLNVNHSNGQTSFKTGWKNFVKDNHLELGDVCFFEKIKSAGVSFRVVIFRDREELSPPRFQVIRKKRSGAQSNIPQKEGVDGNAQKYSTTTTTIFDDSEGPRNNSIISENHFTLSLKPDQLDYAIIPMEFMRKYVIDGVTDVKLRDGERLWPVKLNYSSESSYGVFVAGWSAFVRDCNLKAGDVCLFELVDEQNLVLHVRFLLRRID